MVGVADAIGARGVQRPFEVIDIANQAGLPLPIACAMLRRESYGGYNLWGGDPGPTGGVYIKGSTVTRDAYLAYRDLRNRGIINNQGVGPGQLTARGYQDQADEIGGCWDWRANVTIAFRALGYLYNTYGDDGIRRYNGSGPNAENYRRAILADAATWKFTIDNAVPETVTPPPPPPKKRIDDSMILRCMFGLPNGDIGVAIYSGGRLLGLSGDEKASALACGAPIVDVNIDTWNYLASPARGGSPQ